MNVRKCDEICLIFNVLLKNRDHFVIILYLIQMLLFYGNIYKICEQLAKFLLKIFKVIEKI